MVAEKHAASEIVCTNFSCRQRHRCKKALPIEDMSAAKPFTYMNGHCSGFVELNPDCVTAQTWLDKLFDWNWRFC